MLVKHTLLSTYFLSIEKMAPEAKKEVGYGAGTAIFQVCIGYHG
jgi:hypothetical protein